MAKVLADNNSEPGFVGAFAAVAANYVSTTSGTVTSEVQSDNTYNYTISELDEGYYLVTDSTSSASTATDVVSNYIVQVIPGSSASIASKNSIPTVTKTIGTSEKGTSLSAGDTVSFTLTGTVPSEAANYTTYAYTFKDTLSTNLSYTTGTVKVTMDGDEVDSSAYSVNYDAQVLTISFNDVKSYAGKSIVVTYDATLTASTTTNKQETNEVVVEYSNNPNGTGTGTTVEDKVYVYSFDLTVNKVKEDQSGLAGAVFTLYKSVSLSSADEMVSGKTYYDSSFNETSTYSEAAYVLVDTSEETSDSNDYKVTFGNLGAGDYVLAETKTPDGYNTASNTTFAISATYGADGQISGLTDSGEVTASGSTTGYVVEIENLAGSTIPTTGGIGTTIFYVVGAILVLGATVILVTRRRMANR